MAVFIRVTVSGQCWKQHGCVACGAVFRYLFERTGMASGRPGDDIKTSAERNLARALVEEIDLCPCPCCGAFQPDMVARSKLTWHLTFMCLAVVIGFAIVIPTLMGVLPLDIAGKVAATVVAFTALGHLFTALANPNRSRRRNLNKVQARLTRGTLQIIHAPHEGALKPFPKNLTCAHGLALVAVLLAPVAFLAVVAVSAQYPLPRNAGVNPDVVGPGDEITVPIPCSVRTYGGNWRGINPSAQVLNAAELGTPATLPAASHKQHWGKITAVNDSKHPFEAIKPWVRVRLPEDASLGGNTVRLKVTLAVTYPTQGGTSSHAEQTTNVDREVSVVLAEAGSDALYKQTWNIGKWTGLAACFLGGLVLYLLAQRLKAKAHPHDVQLLSAPSDGRVISGGAGYAIGGLR